MLSEIVDGAISPLKVESPGGRVPIYGSPYIGTLIEGRHSHPVLVSARRSPIRSPITYTLPEVESDQGGRVGGVTTASTDFPCRPKLQTNASPQTTNQCGLRLLGQLFIHLLRSF